MDLPSVAANPWLSCSLWLLAYAYLPGMSWRWILARPDEPWPRWAAWLFSAVYAIVLSLIMTLLSALLLAGAGWFTPSVQRWTTGALVVLGLGSGWFFRRAALLAGLRETLPALPVLLAGFACIMLIPERGEWLVGGWDPGIYVNQGVAVSRTGSFDLGSDPVFARLSAKELPNFTRPSFNFTEAFPVVPLDPARRSLQHFFFRLFPTLVAVLDRCGGLRAATRANDFMGWMCLFVFAAAALRLTRRPSMAAGAVLALLTQSIWVYHLRIPTTEMLQLTLLCGLAFLLPDRTRHFPGALTWALLLLLGVINRFAFVMFGGLLLLLVAWLDTGREDRRLVWRERLLQVGALGIGALYDFLSAPIALGRLGGVVLTLSALFGLAIVAAWLVDHAVLYRCWPKAFSRAAVRPVYLAGLVFFSLILGVSLFADVPLLRQFHFNLATLRPFLNPVLLILALVGAATALWLRDSRTDSLRLWLLFLLAATFATLANAEIAALMPWASRRYVEYTVPLLALLAGIGLGGLGNGGWLRKTLALLGAAALVTTSARQTATAWETTEYDGLSRILVDIARQIEPPDVVVADHFLWATPLRMIYNKPMINGELFLDPLAAPRQRKALAVLSAWQREGARIRFLTSTDKGLDIFPTPVGAATLDWSSPPVVMRETRHHKTADGFTLREKMRVFQLYTWHPDVAHDIPETPLPAAGQEEPTPPATSSPFPEGRGPR